MCYKLHGNISDLTAHRYPQTTDEHFQRALIANTELRSGGCAAEQQVRIIRALSQHLK